MADSVSNSIRVMPATPDDEPLESPMSLSADSSEATTPLEAPDSDLADPPKRVPSLRSVSDSNTMMMMNPISSSPLRVLANARNPRGPVVPPPPAAASMLGAGVSNDVMARMRDFHQKRLQQQKGPVTPSLPNGVPPPMSGPPMGGSPGGKPSLRLPTGAMRPGPGGHPKSAPIIPGAKAGRPSLSERRLGGMKLGSTGAPGDGPVRPSVTPKLSDMGRGAGADGAGGADDGAGQPHPGSQGSKMDDFKKYIDTDKGWITFDGAATITRTGVNFANGHTFSISLDEIQLLEELGKGNYGTVYKVRHAKPRVPRFGPGLTGMRSLLSHTYSDPSPLRKDTTSPVDQSSPKSAAADDSTGVVMAMKEIRLELDDAKFTTILKELVILHECVSPFIIEFYGAFFQEGAVYICIEYMDGGSIDKLYAGGIPEGVLRKITYSTVMGLKSLKDEHNIIHRDVKPTNVLVNTRGQVKICDFGVSGNLVASIAKTNIGCQSYMAPERISSGGMSLAGGGSADGTYSVQSDIWSLGLTVIECAKGRYPYPPEISSTIFGQLSAIVDGEPPDLPEEGFSSTAREFVKGCLNKSPKARPTYAMLLNHPWLASLSKPLTISEEPEDEPGGDGSPDEAADRLSKLGIESPFGRCRGTEDEEVAQWVRSVFASRGQDTGPSGAPSKPALHAAPLETASPAAADGGAEVKTQ